jgi:hypothetical protein
VIFNTIDFGEVKLPEFKNPNALSEEDAVTPFAQFTTPPLDPLVTTLVPVVPYAWLVTVVPVDQSVPILNPVGSVAVLLLPIPSKFSENGVFMEEMLICALEVAAQTSKQANKMCE